MNSTDPDLDIISMDCDTTFNPIIGCLAYIGSLFYLLPGLVLHILILKCVLITHKKRFKGSSFFLVFTCDSVASSILILLDIFPGRFFLYVWPLCPLISPYFFTPSIFLRLVYYCTSHARFAKSVCQISLVFNRMSCVLMPTSYSQIWKFLSPLSIVFIALLPFFGIWNVILSPRMFIIPALGGFSTIYQKFVSWAALSLFQSIFILTTLFVTIICTTVTLFKLVFLTERIKSAEKSLCFTSIFISITFLLVAGTQLCYVFCKSCQLEDWLFVAQFLAFDTFTVGSALIMVISNSQLRDSIFPRFGQKQGDRVFQMSTNSFTHS